MEWLRKLFAEIVELMFMMVGITPPDSTRTKDKKNGVNQENKK